MGIYINDERKLFSLTTENTEYAFCIDKHRLYITNNSRAEVFRTADFVYLILTFWFLC